MTSNTKNILTHIFLIFCFIATALFVFRGMFTPLGDESFGRVWHYFLGWNDFGFSRRGLLGTILEIAQLTNFINDPYSLAYLTYTIILISFFIILAKVIIESRIGDNGTLIIFGLIFSPGLFMQFGYTTGNLDVLLFLLITIIIFYLRNIYLILSFMFIGLLTHEMFIIFLPFFILIRYISTKELSLKIPITFLKPTIILVFSIFAFLIINICGTLDVPQAQFDSVMQNQLGRASYKHPLWSGFYEVSTSVVKNMSDTHRLLIRDFNDLSNLGILLACVPYLYLICLFVIFFQRADLHFFYRALFILAMLLPLTLSFLANDIYRWVGFSIKLCLIAFIYLASKNKIYFKKIDGLLLSLFVFSGPYGDSSLLRPMPVIQFIFLDHF